ncbi:MAG: DHH family phosphoesterase [Candidatus Saccharimonadales bacterium]
MYDEVVALISDAKRILVVQAENPDGDSLGSALALEELLGDIDKEVQMYCPVDIPKYLRYFTGWDRVSSEFDTKCDLVIIVDTSADILLTKVLETPGVRHFLESHPVLVIDHHTTKSTLTFNHVALFEDAISTSEVIFRLARSASWHINQQAAEHLLGAQLADSLGLSIQSVTPESYQIAAELTALGAHVATIEDRRRQFMKKSQEILHYKGVLLGRIEYMLDGKLALVHIPWEEIQAYSDQYNPSVLVLDEMRLVENVEVAVAVKTYPDGKLTGKLRSNVPISEQIAGYFGGGGHPYAAGFRVYENYDTVVRELVTATAKAMDSANETS